MKLFATFQHRIWLRSLLPCALLLCVGLSGIIPVFAADAKAWKTSRDAGRAAVQQNDLPAAEKNFLAALEEANKFDAKDPRLAGSVTDLAVVYIQTGALIKAEPLCRRALALREKRYSPGDLLITEAQLNLATTCAGLEKYAEAESLYARAEKNVGLKLGPFSHEMAMLLIGFSRVLVLQEKFAEAEPRLKKALQMALKPPANITIEPTEPALGGVSATRHYQRIDFQLVTEIRRQLAFTFQKQGKLQEALAEYQQAVANADKELSPDSPVLPDLFDSFAQFQLEQNKLTEAGALVQRALAIADKISGAESPRLVPLLETQASILLKQGKSVEAEATLTRITALRAKAVK